MPEQHVFVPSNRFAGRGKALDLYQSFQEPLSRIVSGEVDLGQNVDIKLDYVNRANPNDLDANGVAVSAEKAPGVGATMPTSWLLGHIDGLNAYKPGKKYARESLQDLSVVTAEWTGAFNDSSESVGDEPVSRGHGTSLGIVTLGLVLTDRARSELSIDERGGQRLWSPTRIFCYGHNVPDDVRNERERLAGNPRRVDELTYNEYCVAKWIANTLQNAIVDKA